MIVFALLTDFFIKLSVLRSKTPKLCILRFTFCIVPYCPVSTFRFSGVFSIPAWILLIIFSI